MDSYINKIKEVLGNNVLNISLVSKTSNYVFKVVTKNEVLYVKFYMNNSSHIDHELYLYKILDKEYLKELVISSNSPKFAVFKELNGKTLDELSKDELMNYKNKIVDSLIYFYETIGKVKVNGYGLLDESMNGTSKSFDEFIVDRQTSTQDVLKNYEMLNSAFTRIYDKYKYLITSDNCLVPIDTNFKNIMITDDGIKFIDPGELISGPKLMGYGDFVAHCYKTELYYSFINKLNLSADDMKRVRIYAVFSSLNILAFLEKLGVDNLKDVIPYGNKYSFYDLISEHLSELNVDDDSQLRKGF